MIYHDISLDIPPQWQALVRQAFFCWLGLVVCLLYQFICASIMLGEKVPDKVTSWFLSIVFMILGIPLGWVLWYRRIYFATKNDSWYNFLQFFLMMLVHFGWCVWCSIAFPFDNERWAFTGFITAMDAFDVNTFVGTIYIIGACLWVTEAVFSFLTMSRAFLTFRGKKVPANELAMNTMQNPPHANRR